MNCGCCPSSDMLPDGISEVKGSTLICEGALDCVAAATSITNTIMSESGNEVLFETCINDEVDFVENFQLPTSPNDTIQCGPCISNNCEAVLEVHTDYWPYAAQWIVMLDRIHVDSDGSEYNGTSVYVEDLAIPDDCSPIDCYEIYISDGFGDAPTGVSASYLHLTLFFAFSPCFLDHHTKCPFVLFTITDILLSSPHHIPCYILSPASLLFFSLLPLPLQGMLNVTFSGEDPINVPIDNVTGDGSISFGPGCDTDTVVSCYHHLVRLLVVLLLLPVLVFPPVSGSWKGRLQQSRLP